MKVKLIERQPTPVVYMRYTGPFGDPISEFWQDTMYPWMLTNNLVGCPRYGISHDDPGITAPEKGRYDAAVEPPTGFAGTGNYLETTIPGGKYATTRFEGKVDDIGGAWATLLRDWLPASGMQLDARPFFEYYAPQMKYNPQTGVFECDLCIPVAAL